MVCELVKLVDSIMNTSYYFDKSTVDIVTAKAHVFGKASHRYPDLKFENIGIFFKDFLLSNNEELRDSLSRAENAFCDECVLTAVDLTNIGDDVNGGSLLSDKLPKDNNCSVASHTSHYFTETETVTSTSTEEHTDKSSKSEGRIAGLYLKTYSREFHSNCLKRLDGCPQPFLEFNYGLLNTGNCLHSLHHLQMKIVERNDVLNRHLISYFQFHLVHPEIYFERNETECCHDIEDWSTLPSFPDYRRANLNLLIYFDMESIKSLSEESKLRKKSLNFDCWLYDPQYPQINLIMDMQENSLSLKFLFESLNPERKEGFSAKKGFVTETWSSTNVDFYSEPSLLEVTRTSSSATTESVDVEDESTELVNNENMTASGDKESCSPAVRKWLDDINSESKLVNEEQKFVVEDNANLVNDRKSPPEMSFQRSTDSWVVVNSNSSEVLEDDEDEDISEFVEVAKCIDIEIHSVGKKDDSSEVKFAEDSLLLDDTKVEENQSNNTEIEQLLTNKNSNGGQLEFNPFRSNEVTDGSDNLKCNNLTENCFVKANEQTDKLNTTYQTFPELSSQTGLTSVSSNAVDVKCEDKVTFASSTDNKREKASENISNNKFSPKYCPFFSSMDSLILRGFCNRDQNKRLLLKYNNDMPKVIRAIVAENSY